MIVLFLALQQGPLAAQHFPVMPRIGTDPQLPLHVAQTCRDTPAGNEHALRLQVDSLEDQLRHGRNASHAWLTLGCARAALGAVGARSSGGYDMPAGESWATGAAAALRSGLAHDPANVSAANLLALIAANESLPDHLDDDARLLAAAIDHGVRGGAALRGCAAFNLRVHHDSVAEHCARLGLAAGTDSTEHLLTIARYAARRHDTVAVRNAFLTAVAVARDTLAQADITWHLQWIMTPDERRAWDTVPPARRRSFVQQMLVERDLRDTRPGGARIVEHFGRLDHADSVFTLKVPREAYPRFMSGRSKYDTVFDPTGVINNGRAYRRWQVDYDDRGMVWMRFGKPLIDVTYSPPLRPITPPPPVKRVSDRDAQQAPPRRAGPAQDHHS